MDGAGLRLDSKRANERLTNFLQYFLKHGLYEQLAIVLSVYLIDDQLFAGALIETSNFNLCICHLFILYYRS